MNYYQPCGAWRAAEGLGLQFGWQRQWTDNVGSGRVQYYSSYMFRPAIVEVYGDFYPGKKESIAVHQSHLQLVMPQRHTLQ